ncbi:hypothetical protein CEXT_803921 [Caerostris extrusa]|uniref:Maturase K n=1 Tax=Caerostris extrusa TaxID=172846 RepID=A0AAV4Y053_CAEEX|nr:hypothetical protein CEXT_803921 [Caerostris extrusa]
MGERLSYPRSKTYLECLVVVFRVFHWHQNVEPKRRKSSKFKVNQRIRTPSGIAREHEKQFSHTLSRSPVKEVRKTAQASKIANDWRFFKRNHLIPLEKYSVRYQLSPLTDFCAFSFTWERIYPQSNDLYHHFASGLADYFHSFLLATTHIVFCTTRAAFFVLFSVLELEKSRKISLRRRMRDSTKCRAFTTRRFSSHSGKTPVVR